MVGQPLKRNIKGFVSRPRETKNWKYKNNRRKGVEWFSFCTMESIKALSYIFFFFFFPPTHYFGFFHDYSISYVEGMGEGTKCTAKTLFCDSNAYCLINKMLLLEVMKIWINFEIMSLESCKGQLTRKFFLKSTPTPNPTQNLLIWIYPKQIKFIR